MEDAATAEISRSQIWQWINAGVEVERDGATVLVTRELAREVAAGELAAIRAEIGEDAFTMRPLAAGPRPAADRLLDDDYADFLTLPAYEQLVG